jgi:hypothetical protein
MCREDSEYKRSENTVFQVAAPRGSRRGKLQLRIAEFPWHGWFPCQRLSPSENSESLAILSRFPTTSMHRCQTRFWNCSRDGHVGKERSQTAGAGLVDEVGRVIEKFQKTLLTISATRRPNASPARKTQAEIIMLILRGIPITRIHPTKTTMAARMAIRTSSCRLKPNTLG